MTHRDSVDVGQLLDAGRWTGYQKWLVALVAMTIVFDGIDNQLLGIVIPTVMSEWGVPRSAFASVVSLGYVGMMLGGMLAGLAGDRFGRRTALLGSMVVFGVMTVVAAMVESPRAFGVLRLLAGIGLGGAMPNAAALAAEYVPVRFRPIAVTITIVCVPLGGTLAGLLGVAALPAFGWRMLFIVGGIVPIVAAVILRFVLPESPQYLARRSARWPELVGVMARMGHRLAPETSFADRSAGPKVSAASLASLFTPEFRRDTFALWGSFFSCLLAVYLGFSWLTSLLTGAGFDAPTANTGITAFNLGGVVGALVGGMAISRFGSRASMLTMAGIAIAGATGLALMRIAPGAAVLPIIAMLALTGSVINGVQTTMYALAAHVYPTAIRATGVGTAVAFGRIGAVLTGYVGSWAIDYGGTPSFFGVVAVMMVITFVSLALVSRHVAPRRQLHSIEDVRGGGR
jgi:AAHS family 4-hydroxybenzoate transporter-like MFS transporter